MTSVNSVLAALAIILIDLFGRAGLDKVLALTGEPARVALWAQLQSVVELVGSVAISGVLQGLTVLTTQAGNQRDERILLYDSLRLGLRASVPIAILIAIGSPELAIWLSQGRIPAGLFLLAALSGCLIVIPATLNAYWLGKHLQQRMLWLSMLTSSVLLVVAASTWFKATLNQMVWIQLILLALIGSTLWRYLHALKIDSETPQERESCYRRLVKFVPVGLTIGILSPVSMLVIRGSLSGSLSWNDVGFLQALWRSTEWVTAIAAGVLSLIFLPRFSATHGSERFGREIMRAGLLVLVPAALLLLLIFFNQRNMLAMLYDTRFVVSDQTALLVLLGSWMRIASWVFLFGLFAAHRTRLIMAGEILSLPLYAFLLWFYADGMSLERAARLYLVSYIVYLGFNALALLFWSKAGSTKEVMPANPQPHAKIS